MDGRTAQNKISLSPSDQVTLREQMVLDYTTCCLCGGELLFVHVTNFVNNEVTEQSSCHSCHIKHVTKNHKLQ